MRYNTSVLTDPCSSLAHQRYCSLARSGHNATAGRWRAAHSFPRGKRESEGMRSTPTRPLTPDTPHAPRRPHTIVNTPRRAHSAAPRIPRAANQRPVLQGSPRADAAAAPHVRSARPRFCARPPAAGKGRQSRASRGSYVPFLCRRSLALPSTSPPWTIGRSAITSCTGCPVWCHLLHRQIPDISGLPQGGVSDWYISVPIGGVSVCLGN